MPHKYSQMKSFYVGKITWHQNILYLQPKITAAYTVYILNTQ